MVADRQSRVTFLAADLLSAAQPSPTPLPKTRVGGFRRHSSGQTSSRRRCRSMFTPGSRGCGYKTVSGRHEWSNQDPLGELGWSCSILHSQRYYASTFSLNNKIWELNDLLIPNGLDPLRLMHPELLNGPDEYPIHYYDPNGLSCASATAHCATEEAITAAACITGQEIPIAGQITCIALGIDTLITCEEAAEECDCPSNNSPPKKHRFSRD
jgi:hypothetical protein